LTAVQQNSRPAGRRSRRGRRAAADRATLAQLPWAQPEYTDPPTEPLDEEALERVHDGAMRILEEIGVDFLNEEARAILGAAGCDVAAGGSRVRMDRAFVMEQVAKAPAEFTITPRNPDRRVRMGGRAAAFGSVASPPNVTDLDRGRRVGNRADFQDLLKLTQTFNCIHFNAGYPVEPVDIHASVRHLHGLYDLLTLTDKVVHAYSLGTERIEDAMEMVRIAAGLSGEAFEASPRMFTNINSTSPLKHDWPMLDGAMRMARRGQPTVVAPFTLAGAMAPVTLAGALAQQTAECLCAVALLEVIRPGAPVVFGAFTSNVDMKSGAPAFGTPEYMRAMQISGQLARRYGLPWRGSSANAANSPDGQAVWESLFSLWGVASGHVNMVFHAAGWLEGGLVASFEKFVMDCELLQQLTYYQRTVGTSDEDLAIDAIREVGPNGNFFDCDHTRARYRDAFYHPFLSDWRNFESWREAGSPKSHEHANRLWKALVAEFEPPAMDAAIREELESFVARRVAEGGAPTDF
jgi:trimethylamine--corrinoid protein Co-methyltransferase